MNKPVTSLIAAISEKKRALGFKNNLLWKIEGDLPRFKALTSGHAIIMGRNTYISIGRPLPNRTNIVISDKGSGGFTIIEGIVIVDSIEKALEEARKVEQEEIFIIGGGMIYKSFIDIADRLYLTIVYDEPEADIFFPDYSQFKKEISKENHLEHSPPFSYIILER
ncbi:MAG: dihydrofolate reductase [Patescibacteria group bacterium]